MGSTKFVPFGWVFLLGPLVAAGTLISPVIDFWVTTILALALVGGLVLALLVYWVREFIYFGWGD